MEDCVARGEQRLSLASDCCRLSRSATFLITGLLCLAKHLLAPSRLFGLRLFPTLRAKTFLGLFCWRGIKSVALSVFLRASPPSSTLFSIRQTCWL